MKKKEKEKNKEQLINKLMKLHPQITKLQKIETNKIFQEEYVKFKQDEEFLRGSEEKYRILVEMATDAIFLETTEGRILECNTAGAKMFGYTKEEMISLTVADLVPEEFAKILPKAITEKETTHGIFVPRINKKKDGTLFPTEIATKLVNIRGKPRLITYIRDITERKKNEKLQGVLYNISKAANSNISLDQLYPLIHKKLGTIIDATNFFIALIDV
jgi:PAS domain S-box-containing protein